MSDEDKSTPPVVPVTPEEAIPVTLPGIPLKAGKIVITPDVPRETVPPPAAGMQEAKLPSQTTPEQDRTTASQRRVNLIWETTQACIAVGVTLATVWVAAVLSIRGDSGTAAFLLLSNSFFLIIGFYFSRTNHTKVGGVGDKEGKER